MDYLTETDSVILLAGSLGLVVGLLVSAQDLAFDWWFKKEWLGWDRAISRTVVSAIVWALLLGAIAFIEILYEPMKPLTEIKSQTLLLGLLVGLLLPGTIRVCLFISEKASERNQQKN